MHLSFANFNCSKTQKTHKLQCVIPESEEDRTLLICGCGGAGIFAVCPVHLTLPLRTFLYVYTSWIDRSDTRRVSQAPSLHPKQRHSRVRIGGSCTNGNNNSHNNTCNSSHSSTTISTPPGKKAFSLRRRRRSRELSSPPDFQA